MAGRDASSLPDRQVFHPCPRGVHLPTQNPHNARWLFGAAPKLRFSALLAIRVTSNTVDGMDTLQLAELIFYVVEIFGLPFAILVFLLEQRKERLTQQEEIFQRLSDEYREFLKLVLDNADLQLLRRHGAKGQELTEEQKERRFAIFGILVSLFERAYILVYEEKMDKQTRRLWQSWEDYMREWVRRADFRDALPQILEGEDPEFTAYIRALAAEESAKAQLVALGETDKRVEFPLPKAA